MEKPAQHKTTKKSTKPKMTEVQKQRFKNGEYIKYGLKRHFIRDYNKGLKGIKNLRQYQKKINIIKKLSRINESSII